MSEKLILYNTLSRKKEIFKPIKDKNILFYHCGPTVYWTQHIGNLRAMVLADLIRRTLEYLGYKVKFARNYTDVGHLTSDADEGEDKMQKGSRRENLSPSQISEKYIKVFEEDIFQLNIITPTFKPRATEYVPQMIKAIQSLLDNGYAYTTPRAIYFDVSKAKDYTRLSGQRLELNEEGAGKGSVSDVNKRNPQDFSLWFFKTGVHKNAIQYWKSPFNSSEVENGEGFPGWHLECSVMSTSLLGETLDIHMGGVEHIPVHHTNEIAQSEAITGKTFVNYWLHNEHLLVDNQKMSKSEGTSYCLFDIKNAGYDPLDLRYLFLTAHYRSKQNFTWESLKAAKTARLNLMKNIQDLKLSLLSPLKVNEEWNLKFEALISDDFNVPGALALIWTLLKSKASVEEKLGTIYSFDKVLGLNLDKDVEEKEIVGIDEEEILKLIEERRIAKENKDYKKADEIREILNSKGIVIEDAKEKTLWHLKG